MNADLHMAGDLKNTGKGNLFVIFGEPDILSSRRRTARSASGSTVWTVFHPQTGEVRSDNAEGIACWFIDTDYNEESSSFAMPTSWVRTIPTAHSKPRLKARDQRGSLGYTQTAIPRAPSPNQNLDELR